MNSATDHLEIQQLIADYAWRIDDGDLEGFAALFRDGAWQVQREEVLRFEGSEALLEWIRTSVRLHDGSPRTRHVTTNTVVEVDGDDATARSYFTVLQCVPPDLPLQVIASGTYRDRFRRRDGRWAFAERVVASDATGELGFHRR